MTPNISEKSAVPLKEIQIAFQYLEFDGTQKLGDRIAEMLTSDGCEDVDCFNLTLSPEESDAPAPAPAAADVYTIFFVSDGAHIRLDAGDYLVRRVSPDKRFWEVWSNEDFKVEFLGVTPS